MTTSDEVTLRSELEDGKTEEVGGQTACVLTGLSRSILRGRDTTPQPGEFEADLLKDISDKLATDRVVFLSCFLSTIAKRAAFSVFEMSRFAGYQQRQGILDQMSGEDSNVATLAAFGQPGALDEGGDGTKATILIDVFGPDGVLSLMRFLPPGDMIADVARRLAELERAVVIIGPPELLTEMAPASRDAIACVEIDYLPSLLRSYRESGTEGAAIQPDLRQQLAQGKWGATPTDQYQSIQLAIQKKNLIDEVLRRRASDADISAVDQHEDIVRPRRFVIDAQEPHATALFVATYFPHLGPMEFRRVVEILLGERTRTKLVWQDIVGENGDIRKTQSERAVSLRAEFAERSDRIRAETQLALVERSGGGHGIGFTLDFFRQKLTEHFESAAYGFLEQRFASILEQGLLFNSVPTISDGAIRIAVKVARFNDEASNIRWLLEMMPPLIVRTPTEESVDGDARPPQEHPAPEPEHVAKVKSWERNFARLLSALLEDDHLRPTARGFLSRLVAEGHHAALLAFLHHMSWRDPVVVLLPWYGRLLAEGNDKIRQETHLRLLDVAKRPGVPLFPFLREVAEWLPDTDGPESADGVAARPICAARFIVVALLQVTNQIGTGRYGVWPSGHSLLDQVFDGESEDAEMLARLLTNPWIRYYVRDAFSIEVNRSQGLNSFLNMIVQIFWLLIRYPDQRRRHQDLMEQIRLHKKILEESFHLSLLYRRDVSPDTKNEIWQEFQKQMRDDPPDILSTMIAEWYVIVRGVEEQAASPTRLNAFRRFLNAYVARLDRRTRPELLTHWRDQIALIRSMMNVARVVARVVPSPSATSRKQAESQIKKLRALNGLRADLDEAFRAASQHPSAQPRQS